MTDNNEQKKRIIETAESTLSLSHGIKNLLQAISASRDLVGESLKRNDIDRAKRGWDLLDRNLIKMQKLVLDMLTYSGESELVFADYDVNRIITSAVKTLQPEADDHGKVIDIEIDESIGKIECDPDMIYDVVLNLIINALEAIPDDAGKIKVSTINDIDNHNVIIKVEDNGPGIKDTSVVFKPFQTSKPKIGTGLGLPISKKIIEQHSGNIQIKSDPGQGATFIVTLPIKQK